ncbi:MAG: GAF domain-containing protein, partial [Desulfobacterales bacterium]|nr:GAF domain-containing protein [Desulfobacterales bacterium]
MKFAGKKSQDLKSLQQKIREMNNLVQIRGKQIRILGKDSQTLSAIFNHTEVGFLIIGHELKIKWNNNIVKIWVEKEGIDDITNIGYKELLNSFGQILPDPGPVEQVFETCGVVNYNFRMGSGINKTNIYMTAMPIQSPDGKVIEVLVMLRDLTDFETLHNSQQELEQSEKLTKTLFRISNAVNTTDNLDDLFESIHEVLANIIDVTNFAIGIYDSNKDIISYPYYVDETNDVYHAIKDVSTSGILAAEVINLKKPLFLSKSDIIKRKKKAGRKSIESNPAQWLGVPLIIKKKAVGVIVVQSYSNPELYSQKDAEILLAVSDQIAFAVDRKRSEEALAKSREQIKNISNQTDQFSLTAASMISANNPKDIFNKISRAIVKFSNYKRVVITYLTDESPYHEILAYDGLKEENIEKYRQVIIRPGFFDNFFKNGTGIGQFSVFIQSFELKKVYNDKLVIKSNKKIPDLPSDSWRLDDMLFVRMQDVSGNLIGFISVDDPKSMRRPTDETVRPLEIFSSLVSQIIINTKSQEELKIAKDAAEASAKSKSKFLANMSHE